MYTVFWEEATDIAIVKIKKWERINTRKELVSLINAALKDNKNLKSEDIVIFPQLAEEMSFCAYKMSGIKEQEKKK